MILYKLKNQKGLTLVELLATIVISSIVVIILFGIFTSANKEYNKQTKLNQDLSDISYALNVITNEIRESDSAFVATDGTIVIEDIKYQYDEATSSIKIRNDSETTVFLTQIYGVSFCHERENLINLSITAKNNKNVSTSISATNNPSDQKLWCE